MNTLKRFAASLLITVTIALPVLADDGHIEIPGVINPPHSGSTSQPGGTLSASLSLTLVELVERGLLILS